jgi:hypothetical protein
MTTEELAEILKSFPSIEVSIRTVKWEYLEIESIGFDDLGKVVEIVVSELYTDDEY